jgi:hypothetical protein
VEEEKSTPSNPVYKPINLPDFQNGNVIELAQTRFQQRRQLGRYQIASAFRLSSWRFGVPLSHT